MLAYVVAKHGVVGPTRGAAIEDGKHGICANATPVRSYSDDGIAAREVVRGRGACARGCRCGVSASPGDGETTRGWADCASYVTGLLMRRRRLHGAATEIE